METGVTHTYTCTRLSGSWVSAIYSWLLGLSFNHSSSKAITCVLDVHNIGTSILFSAVGLWSRFEPLLALFLNNLECRIGLYDQNVAGLLVPLLQWFRDPAHIVHSTRTGEFANVVFWCWHDPFRCKIWQLKWSALAYATWNRWITYVWRCCSVSSRKSKQIALDSNFREG